MIKIIIISLSPCGRGLGEGKNCFNEGIYEMKNHGILNLDRIVFIGRTFDEYMRFFDLDQSILTQGSVLDCAAGPSSFTAEANRLGFKVTACDILYRLSLDTLTEKGREDIEHVFQKVDGVPHLYVWKYYKNRKEIIALRHKALDLFSQDFSARLAEGRYVHAEIPRLPFADRSFSLVLSSHFLFLYGDKLSVDFHMASLKEMARVSSGEVRVYPLQGLDAKPYPHMEYVLSRLRSEEIQAEIIPTPFEFQRGANKMLRLKTVAK